MLRKAAEFLKKMSEFAKAYKLTKVGSVGCGTGPLPRYATGSGYQLLATNWVIKQTIVKPTLGPTIDKVTGAGKRWQLPQVM